MNYWLGRSAYLIELLDGHEEDFGNDLLLAFVLVGLGKSKAKFLAEDGRWLTRQQMFDRNLDFRLPTRILLPIGKKKMLSLWEGMLVFGWRTIGKTEDGVSIVGKICD